MKVEFWESQNGKFPVADYIEDLPAKTQEKIFWVIGLFEKYGTKLMYTKHMKKLEGYDLYELRIESNKILYRIFVAIIGITGWLLHIFIKKSEHTPNKEIKKALGRMASIETGLAAI